MKKNGKKQLSIVLVLAMLLSLCSLGATASTADKSMETTKEYIDIDSTPQNIQALLKDAINSDALADAATNSSGSDVASPMDETTQILESDNLYDITTENGDGTGQVRTFASPIKYVDDTGETQFIDTAMVSTGFLKSLFSAYDYKNAANDFTVEYSKQADKGINMNDQFTMAVYNPDNQKYDSAYVTDSAGGDDILTYPEAFGEDTYVEYKNTSTGIKENIILEKDIGKNTFDFVFKSDLYELILTDDSSMVYVVDKNDHDNIIFTYSDLYVYDAYDKTEAYTSGNVAALDKSYKHYTEDCHYAVTPLEDGSYKVTTVVSEEFLNNPNTIYPVTIDPTINYFENTVSTVDDTFARSNYSANYYTATYMRIGNYSSGICRGYIQTTNKWQTLPVGAHATNATMRLILRTGQTTMQCASLYKITTSSWSGSQITTTSNIAYDSSPIYSSEANYESGGQYYYYLFDLTSTVASWYSNPNSNNGVMLAYMDESIDDYNSVYSSDCGTGYVPYLAVDYAYSETSGITNGGTYYIRSAYSGKYLDVQGGTPDSTNVCQYHLTGALNQQWRVSYQGSGLYTFTPLINTSKRLDVVNASDSNSARIQVSSSTGTARQRFAILSSGSGTYRIQAAISTTRVLDVTGPSTADSINIQLWEYVDVSQQKWIFEKVNTVMFTKINQIYSLAKTYDSTSALELTMQYIRRRKYNTDLWVEVAGSINQDFVTYVNNNYPSLSYLFPYSSTTGYGDTYIQDATYGNADLVHLIATMNGIMKGGTTFESLVVGRWHVANLSGWAGDLQSLITQTCYLTGNSNDYNVFKATFLQILGSENYKFGLSDVLSDVDAYNLINDWVAGYWGSYYFGTALTYYYNGWQIPNDNNWYDGYNKRFTGFLSGNSKDEFKNTVSIYTKNSWTDLIIPLQWPLFGGYTITTNQSNAARDAFTDYIWNKYLLE